MKPSGRTKKHYKDCGIPIDDVERTIPGTFIKKDLFGWADLVALLPGKIYGIQVTGGGQHANRRAKVLSNWLARKWLLCGGGIKIVSWSKQKAGTKRLHWVMREEEVTLDAFEEVETSEVHDPGEDRNPDGGGDGLRDSSISGNQANEDNEQVRQGRRRNPSRVRSAREAMEGGFRGLRQSNG